MTKMPNYFGKKSNSMHRNNPKNASSVAVVFFLKGYPTRRKSARFPLISSHFKPKNTFHLPKNPEFFSSVSNSSHRAAWLAVCQGKVPARTLKTSLKVNFTSSHQKLHTLKTLWEGTKTRTLKTSLKATLTSKSETSFHQKLHTLKTLLLLSTVRT